MNFPWLGPARPNAEMEVPLKYIEVQLPNVVVQLIELFQKISRRGRILSTSVWLIYSSEPLTRSIFHPGERERAGVDHCESSTV